MNTIELNKIFVIEKGNRKARYKVVEHPYFESYSLVKDYCGMTSGKCTKEDEKHMCGGCDTLDKCYQVAYDLT